MDVTANVSETESDRTKWRSTAETLLPQTINTHAKPVSGYDIYPYHSLGDGKIFNGYESLVNWIIEEKTVVLDGYIGVFWEKVQKSIENELQKKGVSVKWTVTSDKMKGCTEIQKLVEPFLGEPNSVWGKKTSLTLADFFHTEHLATLQPDTNYEVNIAVGIGSALLNWDAAIVYLDIPKNEIQFRMRAGSVTNLGTYQSDVSSEMYKRFYFVDWVVLSQHKKNILNRIAVIADAQWKDSLNWMLNPSFKAGLKKLSQSVFRVRPWFEPGAWGGHWMQERIEGLNKEVVNYAWSFELIVPENGIIFESDGNLLEVSFDFLMFSNSSSVLGRDAELFGDEFPIRFDFLDTFDGGNLSIQCHPSLEYIRKEFGENITQDETYYILDCKDNAQVFLGFQDNIDPAKFRKELEDSQKLNQEIAITKYVQSHTAQKHDFFLIPNGTVHSAGTDNLVLEISATPYIFTFKMYDWLRLDLNGNPRPINIDHAFKNLRFEPKGEKVTNELISKQSKIDGGPDWELIHVPTHREHFYDVHRFEFDSNITVETGNVCHILMLVEGSSITVKTDNGTEHDFHYAETFVIPAAANNYTMINKGKGRAKVVKAFVKDDVSFPAH
jgi:mannose-6-phosphate isomerase class I